MSAVIPFGNQTNLPSNEPRTYQDLASKSTPTDIQLLSFIVEEQQNLRFNFVLKSSFLLHDILLTWLDRDSHTDLRTKCPHRRNIGIKRERQVLSLIHI